MEVRDAAGRRWRITTPALPWRSWVLAKVRGDDKLAPAPPRNYPAEPPTRADRAWDVVAFLFNPEVMVYAVLLSPVLLVETVVRLVAGLPLWVARLLGRARDKVVVVAYSRGLVHSRTVLLTRDKVVVVAAVAARLAESTSSFHPSELGSDVEVTRHRSVWQSSGEWV